MFIQEWDTVKMRVLGKKLVALKVHQQVSVGVSSSKHGWEMRRVRGEVINKVRCNMDGAVMTIKQQEAQINKEGRTASADKWIH